ncbi:MAG TPA: pantoate--beta-alanine ligase [Gaiellaceae bacterium]|nr:pantoate--beta-alanine ligase [Gaiellaceae bacterium]
MRPGPDGTLVGCHRPVSTRNWSLEMQVVTTKEALRALPRDGSVGLIPTMGALHEGHAALFGAAYAECDVVVASLFVNAPQFSDPADLDAYPRDRDRDERFAAEHGVDVLFAPEADEMYPTGFATWIEPGGAALGLEGERRPGHFRAVATVCVKLLNLVQPDRAYFGRKDAQQVAVLKQVVRDLDLPVEIRVVPTVRDADGLALSSRNARLSADERDRALAIPRALATRDPTRARAVLAEAGIEPEYVAVADLDGPTLAVAARVGTTRLIDNVLLDS